MKRIILPCVFLVACSSVQEDRETSPEVEAEIIGQVVLTTAVAPVSFEPADEGATSFPESTHQLYVAFLVTGGELPLAFQVSWHREGQEDSLASSRVVVTRHRWMASLYDGIESMSPGRHFVRIALDDEVLGEVAFTIEGRERAPLGEIPQELSITDLRIVRELDDSGQPVGPSFTVLPADAREAFCIFTVNDAPAGTVVLMRWVLGGEVQSTAHLGQVEGRRALAAGLRGNPTFTPGLHRAEIVVNGVVERSIAFTVERPDEPGSAGPQVANLVLTTAVHPQSGRPEAAPLNDVPVDLDTLYLSFSFTGMPYDDIIEVRWIRDATGEVPESSVGTSSFQVSGRGSLAASLRSRGTLELGPHHVEVVRRGRVMATVRFDVVAVGD